jgi:type VI secretion system protein
MFAEKSLLERLAKPKGSAARTLSENTGELVRSVLRHLQKLLNSRREHAPAQMDYGIPDSTEVVHNFPESIAEMQRAIRESIEKYEPRLSAVNVVHVEGQDDQFTLRFQITAQLSTPKDRPHVCFDTLVDSAGRVQVRY